MDLSRYQIAHAGEVRDAGTFGHDFLPELDRVVRSLAPGAKNFLEWGTGLSTLLLAEIAAERFGTLVTIDHAEEYARSVLSSIPATMPVRSLTADLTGPKLSQADTGLNYSSLPLALGRDFDFIYIDGRRRMECAWTAFILSSPETIVVLHDYRRARYQQVKMFFEIVEDGPHFRVMRPRADLLAATAAQRRSLASEARAAGGMALDPANTPEL